MKFVKISYWTTTLLVALAMLASGAMHLTHNPQVTAAMQSLGYPLYMCNILGTAKVLGALALLVPGFARIKEWAYAGFTFLFLGAAASHLALHQPAFAAPLVVLALLVVSYLTWKQQLKLATKAA